MNAFEIRTLRGLQVRDAAADSGHIGILTGHAAVFNSDSVEFSGWDKPWVERIAPGAFARTLRESPDVVALWSHRSDMPIARAPGTLSLAEDDTGLAIEIALIDTGRNRDLLADVRAGNVDAMSFGFEAVKTMWEETPTRDVRTLQDVNLIEVSPVVWPAYPGTSIAARSLVARSAGPDLDAELRATCAERAACFAARRPAPVLPTYFPALRLIA